MIEQVEDNMSTSTTVIKNSVTIKYVLERFKLSSSELSKLLGVTEQDFHLLISGQRQMKPPLQKHLNKICEVLEKNNI